MSKEEYRQPEGLWTEKEKRILEDFDKQREIVADYVREQCIRIEKDRFNREKNIHEYRAIHAEWMNKVLNEARLLLEAGERNKALAFMFYGFSHEHKVMPDHTNYKEWIEAIKKRLGSMTDLKRAFEGYWLKLIEIEKLYR